MQCARLAPKGAGAAVDMAQWMEALSQIPEAKSPFLLLASRHTAHPGTVTLHARPHRRLLRAGRFNSDITDINIVVTKINFPGTLPDHFS